MNFEIWWGKGKVKIFFDNLFFEKFYCKSENILWKHTQQDRKCIMKSFVQSFCLKKTLKALRLLKALDWLGAFNFFSSVNKLTGFI